MISERQKLLQPASEPSPTMQAFLEGAEKLKNKKALALAGISGYDTIMTDDKKRLKHTPSPSELLLLSKAEEETINMNLRNLEMSMEISSGSMEGTEKSDCGKEDYHLDSDSERKTPVQVYYTTDLNIESMLISSDTLSSSQTESQCTVREADNKLSPLYLSGELHTDTGSELESASGAEDVSDTDEAEENEHRVVEHDPPRVEIEDEFGVSLSLDEDKLLSNTRKSLELGNSSQIRTSTSVGVVSSSDSRESLNSGAFLKTELSEWSRESGAIPADQSRTTTGEITTNRAPLALHLDSIDFADLESDGSPTTPQVSKISDVSNSSPASREEKSTTKSHPQSNGVTEDTTVKSTSANGLQDHKKDFKNTSVGETKPVLIEAINESLVMPREMSLFDKKKFAMLDRVVPFSKARDSLDYRKLRNSSSVRPPNVRNYKNLHSASKKEEADHDQSSISAQDVQVYATEAEENSNNTPRSPVTARRIQLINQERTKQNDLIKSMVMDRIRRNPEKNKRGSLSASSTELLTRAVRSTTQNFESGSGTSISSASDKAYSQKSNQLSSDTEKLTTIENTNQETTPTQGVKNSHKHCVGEVDMNDSFDMAIRAIRDTQRSKPYFESPSIDVVEDCANLSSNEASKHLNSGKKSYEQESCPRSRESTPSFYRSMPDLSKEAEGNGRFKVIKVSSFVTPNEKIKAAQRSVSLVNHERTREEARERARLKTDAELVRAHQGNIDSMKDIRRRKLSFAEDDVYNPNAEITAKVHSTPESGANAQYSYTIGELDGTENITGCIRPDVDYPMKKNPFLVSAGSGQQMKQDHRKPAADDFVQLNLHVASKPNTQSSSSVPANQFPTFFSTTANNAMNPVQQKMYFSSDKSQKSHTRSLTVTGIKLENAPINPGTIGFRTETFSTKIPIDGMNRNQGHNTTHALTYTPQFDNTNLSFSKTHKHNKTKALSTETLLENAKFSIAPEIESEPFHGISVPDVTRPSSSADPDKSSSASSPSSSAPKDNKFSIFKLTPKLLHKEKLSPSPESGLTRGSEKTKSSKNPRASFMSYLSQPDTLVQRLSSSGSSILPTSSPGVASPVPQTPDTSKDTSVNTRSSKSKHDISMSEKQRNNDLMEIQLQLESVETEQRQMEQRDDGGQEQAELMEEWFTLVREKVRLSRFEKEVVVRAREVELDFKEETVGDALETSLMVNDCEKSPEQKAQEVSLFQELNEIKRQRAVLRAAFREEMLKYEREDAELEERCSSLNPRESNV